MFQEFFTDTVQSKFIKELLYKTPVPLINSVVSGDYVLSEFNYVYGDAIIECTKSGILGDTSEENGAKYRIVRRAYELGDKILGVTENYISEYNYYDTDTHYKLGNLLRVIRDTSGVNLMPYYNCFGYSGLSGFHMVDTEDNNLWKGISVIDGTDDSVKLLSVPIKFGKTYTIAIDSPLGLRMAPVIFGKFGLVPDVSTYVDMKGTGKRYAYTQFDKPLTYSLSLKDFATATSIDEKKLYSWEKNLYLVLQVPASNTSSVVVLEGDYTEHPSVRKGTDEEVLSCLGTNTVIDTSHPESLSDEILNKYLSSPLSLLRLNSNTTHAFSSRLVEYLLLNVITSSEIIGDNVEDVQKIVMDKGDKYIKGVWNNLTRIKTYKTAASKILSRENKLVEFMDMSGFVDRDTEELIKLQR